MINNKSAIKITIIFASFFTFVVSALGFATTSQAVSSKESISLSPVLQEITLSPGEQTTYEITITNKAETPIGIHLATSPLDSRQIPDLTVYNGLHSQSFLSWISLSQTDFLLPELSSKTITVTIDPPSYIPKGGYYASLQFTPIFYQQQKTNHPIVLAQFIAILFANYGDINYTNLAQKTHILSFHPTSWIFESKPQLDFSVVNDYFTHFSAKPFLTVTPLFGKPQIILLEEKHILPGTGRKWSETVHLTQYSPLYFAHLAVSIGNGNEIFADSFFFVLPYHIVIILLLSLLILSMILIRKRLLSSLRILLQG